MNQFERISINEYQKTVSEEFKTRNEIISFQNYDALQIPRRATRGSAGYDFFSPVSFQLKAGETIKIPTCMKCQLNQGNVLMLFPRSSYGFKYRMQLDNTVGIIDQDYYNNTSNEGHIYIKITNDSKNNTDFTINQGDAFAQGIIMPFILTDDDKTTHPRTGGIGSTSQRTI